MKLQELESGPDLTRPPVGTRGARLRLLLVVEPGLDGVFRHVEGLVAFVQQRDVDVHLAFSSVRSGTAMLQLVERVRAAGGSVCDLKVSNLPQPGDVSAFLRLLSLVRRVKPDIIHGHSSKGGALARMVAAVVGHPRCYYTPHAYYGLAKPPWLRVRFFNRIERMLGRRGGTIAISRDEADFAVGKLDVPAERIVVIHNPVDTERFRPPSREERAAARRKHGIPADAVVLATIGRMCWQKDPETAYHGAAPVCAEEPGLRFLHLGWGRWKPYLLELGRRLGCGSQVRILDYVDDPRSFYHAVDGVLITSRYEAGWPLVLLEALACNLPVVASACPGMSDLDRAGLSHVWTFAPEDRAACTHQIRRWLATARQEPRPCNHRAFAVGRLSPERCFGAVLDLYRQGGVDAPVSPLLS